MSSNQTMTVRDFIMLIALALIWGGAFFATDLALRDIPPLTLAALRVSISAVVLIALVLVLKRPLPLSMRLVMILLIMGLFNNAVPFSLISWGQTKIAGGLASILNATTPLFAIVIGALLSREERMTPGRIIGVLLGIAGVAVLVGPNAIRGFGGSVWGQLAILGAACSYGLAVVVGRRWLKGLDPMLSSAGQLTASSLLLLPIALIIEQPWSMNISATTAGAIIHLTLAGTVLAYLLYFTLLNSAGATNTALVTFLVPVSAILLGALFIGEKLPWTAFAGMALIFIGLATIDGRLFSRRSPRQRPG